MTEKRLARTAWLGVGADARRFLPLLAYGLLVSGIHTLETQRALVLPAVLLALPGLGRAWAQLPRWSSAFLAAAVLLWLYGGLASPAREVSLPMAWLFVAPLGLCLALRARLGALEDPRLPWCLLVPALLWSLPTVFQYGLAGAPAPFTRDPNVVGDVLVLVLLFGVNGLIRPAGRSPLRLALACLLAGFLALTLFAVLGARMAGVLGFLALSGLLARRRQGALRWVVLAYGLAWLAADPFSQAVLHRPLDRLAEGFAQGGHRWGLLQGAWALFLEAPLFGSGLLTYGLHQGALAAALGGAGRAPMAHNDPLQLLAEVGVVGMGALLGLLLPALLRALVVLFRTDGRDGSAALAPWALGLGVVLGHSLINFPLYDPGLWSFVVFAAAVLKPQPKTGPSPPRRPFAASGVLGLLGAPPLAVLTLLAAAGLVQGPLGAVLGASGQFAWGVRLSAAAPFLAEPWHLQARAGAALWREGARAPVLEDYITTAYGAARERGRLYPLYYAEEAEFLVDMGQREAALAILARGFAVDPADPRLWAARLYAAEGDRAAVAQAWLPHCVYGQQRWPALAHCLWAALPPGLPSGLGAAEAEAWRQCRLAKPPAPGY